MAPVLLTQLCGGASPARTHGQECKASACLGGWGGPCVCRCKSVRDATYAAMVVLGVGVCVCVCDVNV